MENYFNAVTAYMERKQKEYLSLILDNNFLLLDVLSSVGI